MASGQPLAFSRQKSRVVFNFATMQLCPFSQLL
jgi:hypothetical protein